MTTERTDLDEREQIAARCESIRAGASTVGRRGACVLRRGTQSNCFSDITRDECQNLAEEFGATAFWKESAECPPP